MLLQITSGQGPDECKLAVRLLCAALQKEYAGTQVLDVHPDYASALLDGPDEPPTESETVCEPF